MKSSENNKYKSAGLSVSRSTFPRSISPSGRFCSSTISSSSMSTFSSPARSTSPSRITVRAPSIRFSIDHRHTSPGRTVTSTSSTNTNRNCDRNNNNSNNNKVPWSHGSKKTCLCSPTTHPGSFRCSLHKNLSARSSDGGEDNNNNTVYRSHRLHARRSAMTNSLVRIGTVEGDLVKRALAALIRPSSHQQRRRSDFQPRPSRLSVTSKADD
ncbi:uncharacterized protein LOC143581204 [Bidens hawaiensis]|uniref:uncharacterized protein LOC143581204 n=1 Tax=Bidens hawaiensis TaxID=980011 RepID=UPI00404A3D67